jgi:16S rRNA processing protein RimM
MLLVVGRIGRAHGVRGDLFVEPMTDEPEVRFAPEARLIISNNETLTVAQSKWHSGRFVVHFVGIDDRNQAETLKGIELRAEVDPLALPDNPDEFYDHQLVGLKVILAGQQIGNVTEVVHLPSQDLLAVRKLDLTEFLIPFVKEFVPDIDLARSAVTITPPVGLIDEHNAIVAGASVDSTHEDGTQKDGTQKDGTPENKN